MNSVAVGCQITLRYTLSTEDEVIDSTEGPGPLTFCVGAGQVHPAIEKAIIGRNLGEAFEVVIDPNLGFGDVDPSLKITVAKRKLPEAFRELKPGASFTAPGPDGKKRLFRVVGTTDHQLIIDGNSPLSGKILYLHAEVLAVNSAPITES